MTNNKKQTAVEWLRQTLRHNSVSIFSGNIADQAKNLEQVFQQAKEMQKLQLQHAQCDGAINWDSEQTFEQYYNETYGEDNYSENLEQWAWDNPCLSRSDVYNLFEEVFKTKRLTFDKTYAISAAREVRYFKDKLRQLAKDKSELLKPTEKTDSKTESVIDWFLNELLKEGYIKRLPVLQFQQAKKIDSEEKLIDYSDGYTDGFKRALELVELTVEEHKTIVYDRTLEKIHSRIKELKE